MTEFSPGWLISKFALEYVTLELFSGTGSFSKVAKKYGATAYTLDTCPKANDFGYHTSGSILDAKPEDFPDQIGRLWASPPCEGFSIAAIGKSWTKELPRRPKSDTARLGMQLLDKTVELIAALKPRFFYIENPRGMMRKVIDPVFEKHGIQNVTRRTVCYCKYGDTRMKPTDIWTNDLSWRPREMCHNYKYDKDGNIIHRHCHHESAQRGAKTGTQGSGSYREKSRIPAEIFQDLHEHGGVTYKVGER